MISFPCPIFRNPFFYFIACRVKVKDYVGGFRFYIPVDISCFNLNSLKSHSL